MSDPTSAEQWRDLPGYLGIYQVSSHGRVRSLPRTIIRSNGAPQFIRGRIMKTPLSLGYPVVNLSNNGPQRVVPVHRLIMLAFYGPRPAGTETRHLDGDKLNCVLSNLTYGTQSENSYDRVQHGTHNNASKTHCKRGHEFAVANTLHRLHKPGRNCRACRRLRDIQRALSR